MKREIKFRGWFQGINGTEMWVYGYLVKQTNGNWEITNGETSWTVDNVGQFTGLKDKNEVEVYEGDIINIGEIPDKQHFIVPDIRFMNDILHEVDRHVWLEVIGNFYDNPDLIK